ncbi:hypothetical protein [Methylobacterium indicum]|uniref:Uncharacterized protein n=1 Tax=Methylobacterium indicum TaxID=1775910 RepID=A0A8H9C9G7_9HYPH|nr:hypothetical protein [Methylobacterium indicum]BCM88127.1 hypothetical protein mvi_65880 [Methylobacterium indicum]
MSLSLKLPRRNPDAPRLSLRERAAALKASAAKVMRRTPPAAARPPLAGAGKPSAALAALLAAHEMAYGYALYAEAYGLPDLAERRQAEEEAFRALLHSPLHSDADRAAYAAAVISRQGRCHGEDTAAERDHPMAVAFRNITFGEHAREPEEMRHLGREVAPDPILAAIAASKAASDALDAFGDRTFGVPLTEEHREQEVALTAAEGKTRAAVWQTVPTTPAGRTALVDFARSMVARFANSEGDTDDAGHLLGRILDAFSAMVAADWGNTAPPIGEPAPAPAAIDYGERAKLSAEQIELSGLDVLSLAHLFEAFQAVRFSWEGVVARSYCDRGQLGDLPEFESERAAFALARIADEIASRTPSTDEQRDEILMSRTSYEMMCNGRIHDNTLLADITRAWTV